MWIVFSLDYANLGLIVGVSFKLFCACYMISNH